MYANNLLNIIGDELLLRAHDCKISRIAGQDKNIENSDNL